MVHIFGHFGEFVTRVRIFWPRLRLLNVRFVFLVFSGRMVRIFGEFGEFATRVRIFWPRLLTVVEWFVFLIS